MYYDTFSMGFAYYADELVTGDLLNAVAMKYVLTFHCYDFFYDEFICPQRSPLLILSQEVEKEREHKEELKESMYKKHEHLFARPKTSLEKRESTAIKKTAPEERKEKNRFVKKGRISDFPILQQKAKPSVFAGTATSYHGMFEKEHKSQISAMSYRQYKENCFLQKQAVDALNEESLTI
jgi:hypothetical protein